MRTHPEIGLKILKRCGHFRRELLAVLYHHEHVDGTGYPHGLAGTDIPLESRIVAIADVFDALASERPYKPAWSKDRVVATMLAGRASQFDPELLDVFLAQVVR